MAILVGTFSVSTMYGVNVTTAATTPAHLKVSAITELVVNPVANQVTGTQEKVYLVVLAGVTGGSGNYNLDIWLKQGTEPLQRWFHVYGWSASSADGFPIPFVWSTLCPTAAGSLQQVYIQVNATDASTSATGIFTTTIYIPYGA